MLYKACMWIQNDKTTLLDRQKSDVISYIITPFEFGVRDHYLLCQISTYVCVLVCEVGLLDF